MGARLRNFVMAVSVLLLLEAICPGTGSAQNAGLGLNPARLEVEINPGAERTVAFRIETPPSDKPVQGRLMLTLTDWNIDGQGNVSYADPGSLPFSASPWIIYSPSAISISSGETHLVRLTVRVPESSAPGVYRSAVFVQERPPAAPANPGERVLYFRFRYVFTLYVIVPPAMGKGDVRDVRLVWDRDGVALLCEMENLGARHVRPRIHWTVRDGNGREVLSAKNVDTTVLLPFAAMTVRIPIAAGIPPGEYDLSAQVDFRDGGAVQAISRTVQVPAGQDKIAMAGAVKR